MRSEIRNPLPRLLVVLLAGAMAISGCGPRNESPTEEPELVAEDVGPAVEISIENDIQEAPRKEELVGVMPGGFPEDLPIYLPSSLVDFGDGENGLWVELLSPDRRSAVVSGLRQQLAESRWEITEAGAVWLLEKEGRQVRLDIGEGGAGTLYRYEL